MGFWSWLLGIDKDDKQTWQAVNCKELFEAAADYSLRQLSFEICVDMIANAMGRCEFRTYWEGEEIRKGEYWLWNVEPNPNENSTVFLHRLVDHLYRGNEALVVSFRRRSGGDALVVADSWEMGEPQVTRQNEYKQVTADGFTFNRKFLERDVLHLRLHQTAIQPVMEALTTSWSRMATLARKMYEWDHGEHWKVHVNQVAAGKDDFSARFAEMIAQQVKPFLENPNGVLPEFDGYDYSRMGGGVASTSADLRDLAADIFDFTARGFLIPAVLINGKVEATSDANNRFLTYVIDPLCDQLQEEINRKRYGYDFGQRGCYLRVDSSQIIHYDLFSQAASVEKLVGSGVYSINDILRAVGQGTINEPWADKHYLTKNITEMGSEVNALGS